MKLTSRSMINYCFIPKIPPFDIMKETEEPLLICLCDTLDDQEDNQNHANTKSNGSSTHCILVCHVCTLLTFPNN